MKHCFWIGVWAALLASPAEALEKSRPNLSSAAPIALVHGVTRVEDFDGKGHPAQIVLAWRENMNAHGYAIYSVLMPRPDEQTDWNLVTFETHDSKRKGGSERNELYDEPFNDEQVVASVRFLKAQWKGKRATLAVTARRDLSHMESFIDSVPVEFEIYTLTSNEDGVPGWPFYYFDRVEHFRSDKRYCNSDLALSNELGLPLPTDYAGPNRDDGCIR